MEVQMDDREKIPENSLLGMMKQFLEAVDDMDSTVMIPSRLLDMTMETNPASSSAGNNNKVIKDSVENSRDLYMYFSLLKTIKKDLMKGTARRDSAIDDDAESSEEEDTQCEKAKQASMVFREHLGGLCNVLHQLTDIAKLLTTKYQHETGDFQTCQRPKTFTM